MSPGAVVDLMAANVAVYLPRSPLGETFPMMMTTTTTTTMLMMMMMFVMMVTIMMIMNVSGS